MYQTIKPDAPGLKMTRQYPARAESTADYVRQYESLNSKIFGGFSIARFAPFTYAPTTHYDPTQPICVEDV